MPCASNTSAQAILQIASDSGVSFFVKSDGSLWRGDYAHKLAQFQDLINRAPHSAEAANQLHEEGQHITSANFEPVDQIVPNGVTAVAMNIQGDTFFIKNDGSLWAMGKNYGGSFQIMSNGVTAVACGEDFTIFLKIDGSLWGFGRNGEGELGDGDGIASNYFGAYKRIVDGGVAIIAAGYLHSLFIKRDGSLWGMGNNGYGQLGLGTNINHTFSPVEIVASDVVSVAAAHNHSLFIKSDGSLWAMGLNDFGQIGDCTIDWPYRPELIVSNNVVAVTAGYSGSLFLKKDGSLWGMGINWGSDYGEGIEFQSECPSEIFAGNNSALVAGYYYNAKLKSFASVWAGQFNNSMAGVSSVSNKGRFQSTVTGLSGSNLITIELLNDGRVRLAFSGNAGVNYALERSSSLSNPNWVSLVTNTAPSGGMLAFTNTPDTTINNFWRIRSVP